MVLLAEEEVENILRGLFDKDGFEVEPRKSRFGADIIANKGAVFYYVEVEGNKKPIGEPLTSTQKYTHYLRAIGQLAMRITASPTSKFVLALPEDVYYRNKVNETKEALRRLGIEVYFIEQDRISETIV